MVYDYVEGKKRINNILDNCLEIVKKDYVPNEQNFTFDNAYKVWISAIFVDIRNSTALFTNENKAVVAKIIKSFTSEIIEILRDSNVCEEIGIRGDCVYAVYSSPTKDLTYDIADKTYWINTLFVMMNELFEYKKYPTITAGIGISTAEELIIKAGRKGVGINSKVWIGDAVTKASKLSSLANKNKIGPIAFSNCTYINIIDKLTENNAKAPTGFTAEQHNQFGKYYHGNIVKTNFEKWIYEGMPE